MAYNFEERNLTYIGKVADNLFESINRYECIEYKDAVYFVAVNGVDFSNTQIKVRKLYRINDQEEIIFNRMTDWETSDPVNIYRYLLFIKDDILYIYFFDKGFLYSLDLQDESAELQLQQQQQQLHPFFSIYDHRYMYCFNDPYIYLIDDNIIHEFDCTNVTNMKLKSDLFQGYDKQVIPLYTRNKITLLNGKFYFFESTGLYQVDVESKVVVKLLPANVFSYRFIETTYVTSTNKLRAVGFNNVEEAEYFFMEIDFDKEY